MNIPRIGGAVPKPRPVPGWQSADRQGLTLIEVMIAAMVLVIGILSFFAVFLNCMRLDDESKESVIAVNHARLMVESIRAMPYAEIADMNGHPFDVPDLKRIDSGVPCGFVSVADTTSNLLDVTVTISWAGRTGDRSLDLQARFTPFDPIQ